MKWTLPKIALLSLVLATHQGCKSQDDHGHDHDHEEVDHDHKDKGDKDPKANKPKSPKDLPPAAKTDLKHDHEGHDHNKHAHEGATKGDTKPHDHGDHDHKGHDHAAKGDTEHDHKGHDHGDHDHKGHDHKGHDHKEHAHEGGAKAHDHGNHDHGHGHDHNGEGDKEGTTSLAPQTITTWTEDTMAMVTFKPMTATQATGLTMYLTQLKDYKPVTSGQLTITFSGADQPDETFTTKKPARPGTFRLPLQPKHTGLRTLTATWTHKGDTQVHPLGQWQVYSNEQEALKAPPLFTHISIHVPLTQQWGKGIRTAPVEFRPFDTIHKDVILAPASAISGNTVYVQHGAENFSALKVKTGHRAQGLVEIKEGLAPGQRILTKGLPILDKAAKAAQAELDAHVIEDAPHHQGQPEEKQNP